MDDFSGACPADAEERPTNHRRKQVAILTNAMNEHCRDFTDEDMQRIGYAVFAAVGRIVVARS